MSFASSSSLVHLLRQACDAPNDCQRGSSFALIIAPHPLCTICTVRAGSRRVQFLQNRSNRVHLARHQCNQNLKLFQTFKKHQQQNFYMLGKTMNEKWKQYFSRGFKTCCFHPYLKRFFFFAKPDLLRFENCGQQNPVSSAFGYLSGTLNLFSFCQTHFFQKKWQFSKNPVFTETAIWPLTVPFILVS